MDINFIKSVPPAQHKKIRSWLLVTLVLMSIAILLLLGMAGMCGVHWYTARRAQQQMHEQVKKFDQMTTEHKS